MRNRLYRMAYSMVFVTFMSVSLISLSWALFVVYFLAWEVYIYVSHVWGFLGQDRHGLRQNRTSWRGGKQENLVWIYLGSELVAWDWERAFTTAERAGRMMKMVVILMFYACTMHFECKIVTARFLDRSYFILKRKENQI